MTAGRTQQRTAAPGAAAAPAGDPTAVSPEAVRAWCALVTGAVHPAQERGRWRRGTTGELSEEPGHPRLVAQLRSWIYRDVHLAGDPEPPDTRTDSAALALLTELAAGTWPDGGWDVRGTDGTGVLAEKRGVRLRMPGEDVDHRPDGTAVLRLPRARPGALFGWFGYTGPNGPALRPRARLYLHLPSLTDREVLGAVLEALERLDAPWQAKAAIRGTARPRPDSFVLYLDAADTGRTVDALRDSGLTGTLVDAVPGFSTRVARGTGLAVHPPGLTAGSFGAGLADLFARSLAAHGTDGLDTRILTALAGPAEGGPTP